MQKKTQTRSELHVRSWQRSAPPGLGLEAPLVPPWNDGIFKYCRHTEWCGYRMVVNMMVGSCVCLCVPSSRRLSRVRCLRRTGWCELENDERANTISQGGDDVVSSCQLGGC